MREVTECRWIVAVLPVTVIVNVDVWFAVGHVHAECTEVHTISAVSSPRSSMPLESTCV